MVNPGNFTLILVGAAHQLFLTPAISCMENPLPQIRATNA